MKKQGKIILTASLLLCLSAELFLRFYLGFCDTVLMIEDTDYEYIAAPNQERFRFRNHIHYNSLSMRNEEPDTTSVKILGFGDSIINGGVLTDQESLATSILSKELSKIRKRKVQFLNISAGSWGPDNCFAYLQKHGDFNAEQIFLFVSSHDAYDNMDFSKIVGVNGSFPDKQYALALVELFDRYLLPRLGINNSDTQVNTGDLGISKKGENSAFNSGFMSFLAYSKSKNIPLTLYLHAELSEMEKGSYNSQGLEIINFAKEHNIPLIAELDLALEASDYRDFIHLNEHGQRKLANAVLSNLK